MKVLVLGSNGMAGHVMVAHLIQQGHDVKTLARENADYIIDVENTKLAEKFFTEIKTDFDFIVNCIGLLVKDSNTNPARAAIINSWLPHCVESALIGSKTKLIHLSTDCVFDGSVGHYVETDIHTEMNFYGRSKSYGEVNNDKDITFRMSIIGPEKKLTGTGLFDWICNKSSQTVEGWENAVWNGITTLELAKAVNEYMKNPTVTGIYHLVKNEQEITKYDLLRKINDIFKLQKVIIKTVGLKPVNKVLIDTRKEFNFKIQDYDQQLLDLKNFLNV